MPVALKAIEWLVRSNTFDNWDLLLESTLAYFQVT